VPVLSELKLDIIPATLRAFLAQNTALLVEVAPVDTTALEHVMNLSPAKGHYKPQNERDA